MVVERTRSLRLWIRARLMPVLALGCMTGPGLVFGQEPGSAETALREGQLTVFLDCGPCDFDYTRRTILFASWVRDRTDAQVHVLVTSQSVAGGGRRYQIDLIGQREFEGERGLSFYTAGRDDTTQEVRAGLVHSVELALVRFTAGTEIGEDIQIFYRPAGAAARRAGEAADDPWDFWVFSVGGTGTFAGEESTGSMGLSASLTANRTTEAFKFRFNASGSYSEDRFELSEDEDFTSILRDYRASGLFVGSISDHWSLGFRYSGRSSTFSNVAIQLRFAPAFEYSVFPYAESSERDLRLLYSVGFNRVEYEERTIFGVTEETLFDQSLTLAMDLVQPWGSAQVALDGSMYLNDMSANRISLSGSADWRVFRGFSLILLGNVSRIADQRNLSAGGVTDEEILLRRRELLTSFRYFLSVGVSFTFGSKFANVVNPRFGI